jgi:hypothetical protein
MDTEEVEGDFSIITMDSEDIMEDSGAIMEGIMEDIIIEPSD